MCSSQTRSVVQPAGPPFFTARQPMENSCFSFGNTALQPALRLVLSVLSQVVSFLPHEGKTLQGCFAFC